MSEQLISLALILTVTTGIVLLLRALKQPPIIGYILAGILLGASFLDVTSAVPSLEVLGQLGIALLLFIVGLNLDIKSLQKVGLISVYTGVGQVLFTSAIGFILARTLGLPITASIYIAVALTFSSTIIIVKLLTDKKELDTLHGKIAIGFLIVQDIIVVLVLLFVSSFAGSTQAITTTLLQTALTATIVFITAYFVAKYVLPYILSYAGKSQETIFLFSITWCFAVAAVFYVANLGLEIGALIAGLMIASTPYSYEIASKAKPLRDFFITIFFIVLGSHLELASLAGLIIPAILLSLFVLIGNPLIVMTLMGLKGFNKKTSFKAGLAVAQISEFSLIFVTLGVTLGHVGVEILNLATIIGITTILTSTYLFLYSEQVYARIHHLIPYKKRGVHKIEHKPANNETFDVILFGYNRMGASILEHFHKKEHDYLIIDFDPEIVLTLQQQQKNALLGDAHDVELYEELRLDQVHTVVSTITDEQATRLLLRQVRKRNQKATIIVAATQPQEALDLYEEGADYVIIPHLVGGNHATIMLDMLGEDVEAFLEKKLSHVEELKRRHT
ncbi:MAG: cation:proton antiporter [Candidatus Woesearchaeota archaeon]